MKVVFSTSIIIHVTLDSQVNLNQQITEQIWTPKHLPKMPLCVKNNHFTKNAKSYPIYPGIEGPFGPSYTYHHHHSSINHHGNSNFKRFQHVCSVLEGREKQCRDDLDFMLIRALVQTSLQQSKQNITQLADLLPGGSVF